MKNELISYLKEFMTYKGSLISLILSIFTGIGAGLFLGIYENILDILPGLLILIPPSIALRGNIYASLSSRLGSSMHLGLIDSFSFKNPVIKENIKSSASLAVIMSVILAIMSKIFALSLGVDSMSIFEFVFVSIISGIVSGVFLMIVTLVISYISFIKNWDADNITSPLIMAFGDIFAIPIIILSAFLMLSIPWIVPYFAMIFIILAFLNLAFLYYTNNFTEKYSIILKQSIPILLFAGVLSGISGIILESQREFIIPFILIIFPAFLEECGSIGTLMTSRLSTKLHLGTIEVKKGIDRNIKREVIRSYILSMIIFPILGVVAYLASSLFNIAIIPLTDIILTMVIAGFFTTTIIILFSYFVSVFSFKKNIDPDNVAIPIITGLTDFVGMFMLLASARLIGLI